MSTDAANSGLHEAFSIAGRKDLIEARVRKCSSWWTVYKATGRCAAFGVEACAWH